MKRLRRINWQQILPWISIAGVIGTAVCATRAGIESEKILTQKKFLKINGTTNYMVGDYVYIRNTISTKEKIQLCWKEYILTTACMALTIGSILANKQLSKKEAASLALLGTASSKLLTDYRRAVQETMPDQYQDVVRRVTSYRDHDVEIADPPTITCDGFCDIITDRPFPGDDEVLFYDELFDRWFRTSLAVVRTAQYHLNRNFILRGEVSMLEFYEFIGLEAPDEFRNIGWGYEFLEGGCSWIDFNTILSDKEDGEKFFILSYTFAPENLNYEY